MIFAELRAWIFCRIKKSMNKIKSISIVGAGKAGETIAILAAAQGLIIRAVSSLYPEDAESLASRLKPAPAVFGPPSGEEDFDILLDADCIFLSVPDWCITGVAADITSAGSQIVPRGRIVCHMSGYFGPDLLSSLEEAGWSTGCFHPLKVLGTVEDETQKLLCPVAVSGSKNATAGLVILAEELGGNPFIINDSDRILYHAAASMAANGASVMIAFATELMESTGLSPEEARQGILNLVESAVSRARADGPRNSLTGPASRGDAEVVAGHFAALSRRDDTVASLYRTISLGAIQIARARGDLDGIREEALRKALNL